MAANQRHFTAVVTLTGVAQQLSAVIAGISGFTYLREISLQGGAANVNPFYVGHDGTVSATVYGTRIPAPTTGEPAAPWIRDGFLDGTARLEEFWVFGTVGEKVHVDLILNDYALV